MKNLIYVKNLYLNINEKTILEDITFELNSQEIITIIGPNGSGKSSLLKLIIGKYLPTKGEIKKKKGLKIGYVPQKFDVNSIPALTVKDYIGLYTDKVDITIKHLSKKDMRKLSGGELQKVMFARALAIKPDVLILDEPTQGLDFEGIKLFYKNLLNIRELEDISIILSSHDLNFVMKNTDRVICLNQHICCQGKPEDIAVSEEFLKIYGSDVFQAYKHDHNHCH